MMTATSAGRSCPEKASHFVASMSESLRICVYNYKGGAAKTTLVVNAAAALAHPDHVPLLSLNPGTVHLCSHWLT